jgi:polygalacturonase
MINTKIKTLILLAPILFSVRSYSQYLDITKFGAKEGSDINNAIAIQKAIDKCAVKGGIVQVPPGKYYTGTIILKSNVTLSIMKGAELIGTPNLKDYPENTISVKTRPPHRPQWPSMPSRALIYADAAEHISIIGEGTINGNGKSREFNTQDDDPRRPKLLMFVGCKDVNIQDIHLMNSAFWMQHYFACDGVKIRGISVYNHSNLNNDGIDIDSRNVTVSDCTFDCDDDGICLKSDGFDVGKRNRPVNYVENVILRDIIITSNGGGSKKDAAMANIPENKGGYPANNMFGNHLPAYGFFIRHAKNVELHNVKFNLLSPDARPAVYQSDVKNLIMD